MEVITLYALIGENPKLTKINNVSPDQEGVIRFQSKAHKEGHLVWIIYNNSIPNETLSD